MHIPCIFIVFSQFILGFLTATNFRMTFISKLPPPLAVVLEPLRLEGVLLPYITNRTTCLALPRLAFPPPAIRTVDTLVVWHIRLPHL